MVQLKVLGGTVESPKNCGIGKTVMLGVAFYNLDDPFLGLENDQRKRLYNTNYNNSFSIYLQLFAQA